ncbi:organic hydroperoxide resistance protein [Ephemerocybe angulata]|uniref:Organic hydroperoxide resistance protein n=1 Tax=Ephemerocybe angulata TaxID=980116 RepID=A0A8H6HPP9_9AGAR|nr:organic hydroperoxide resistance protein [Tulosesus angulatus]
MNTLLRATSRRALASTSRRQVAPTNTRWVSTLKEYKYTAKATATGAGRNGHVESEGLKFDLAVPKELGGTGKGQNPEQLFALGYAGCFLGAIQFQARQLGKKEQGEKAVVHAEVHIGPPSDRPGLGLAVDLTVEGVDDELLQAAHQMCPYSRAVSDSIVVNLKKA